MQEETNYLGFVVSSQGIKADPEKVKVIRGTGALSNVREVCSFLGTVGYYRRMIPNFSGIADPLIKLTKKYAKFKWTEECQKAFDYLKESLSVIPLLGYPDVEKNFYILYVDTSNYCVGGALVQPCEEGEQLVPGVPFEKPIYFLSHKLSETQQRWSTIEKEAFAIKYALE